MASPLTSPHNPTNISIKTKTTPRDNENTPEEDNSIHTPIMKAPSLQSQGKILSWLEVILDSQKAIAF